jgi:putative glutamine amidotransferase
MPPPLIGLTTYNNRNQYGFPIAALMHKYISAVDDAGGVPVLIPSRLTEDSRRSLVDRLDGIIFTGGGDIAIDCFGGEPHKRVDMVDGDRDKLEIALVKELVAKNTPFLGICRGIQVINVALGGTLYTHIADQLPSAIKHDFDSGKERETLAHEVVIIKGTCLGEISGLTGMKVNSLHHQGVKIFAPGLTPSAYSSDGLIEGLELPDHPFGVAVQWHPEWLVTQEPARRLFLSFVKAAADRDK